MSYRQTGSRSGKRVTGQGRLRGKDWDLGSSEASYRATFNNAAVGMAHVALDGRWLRFNDAVCAITGYSRESLQRLTFGDITHPEDLDSDWKQAKRLIAGEIQTYAMEKRYLRADRTVVWVNLTVSAVRDAVGSPVHFISIIEDISARKRTEERLLKSEARLREEDRRKEHFLATLEARVRERTSELAAAADHTRKINEELRKRNHEKEILLREIHHRVKNNLQVICSVISLQARADPDERLLAFVDDCKGRVQSMALVHEHLYGSKDLDQVSLNSYCKLLIDSLLRGRSRPGIECIVEGDATVSLEQAVPCALLINELVTNSLKHAFPNERSGRVKVSILEAAAQAVEVRVADSGIGIPCGVELNHPNSFGLRLVSMLATQLRAKLELHRDQGTAVAVRFSALTAA